MTVPLFYVGCRNEDVQFSAYVFCVTVVHVASGHTATLQLTADSSLSCVSMNFPPTCYRLSCTDRDVYGCCYGSVTSSFQHLFIMLFLLTSGNSFTFTMIASYLKSFQPKSFIFNKDSKCRHFCTLICIFHKLFSSFFFKFCIQKLWLSLQIHM